ncbi:hypothetical protein B0H13DRAFT_2011133 [Mycena leptocephala]|nr:hypothetical protein B0H13DRAFT_2011133 [Mycena leptocephala]
MDESRGVKAVDTAVCCCRRETLPRHSTSSNQVSRKSALNGERRTAIDEELTSLCARIALLRAERNAIAPISVLPNELLVDIFGDFVEHWVSHRTLLEPLEKLMLVCRDWCDVILASHRLWGTITCDRWESTPKIFKLQLSRSGAAPLRIHIAQLGSPDFAPLILANAERVISLDVAGDKSLALSPKDSGEDSMTMDACLPPELLEGRLPRLSRLSLSHIDAHWEFLPPLRSLTLKGGPDSPVTSLTFQVLLGVLRSSPALHTLSLDMMIATGIRERYDPVELRNLELLFLLDSVGHCEDLLKSIIFPASTRLRLHPQGIPSCAQIRDNILIPIRKHLHAHDAPIASTLALGIPCNGSSSPFRIRTYAHEAMHGVHFDKDSIFAINSFPTDAPSPGAICQIMAEVLKALPTQTITHLDASEVYLTCPTWKVTLALLPALEKVGLHVNRDQSATRFCEAALELGHPLCTISIYVFVQQDDAQAAEITDPFFSALTRLLRAYHTRGRPLKHLYARNYYRALALGDEKYAELRGLVGTLVTTYVGPGW